MDCMQKYSGTKGYYVTATNINMKGGNETLYYTDFFYIYIYICIYNFNTKFGLPNFHLRDLREFIQRSTVRVWSYFSLSGEFPKATSFYSQVVSHVQNLGQDHSLKSPAS